MTSTFALLDRVIRIRAESSDLTFELLSRPEDDTASGRAHLVVPEGFKRLAGHSTPLLNHLHENLLDGLGDRTRLIELGERFFSECWPEEAKNEIRRWEGGRLLLDLDEALLGIPWELAHDGRDFIACRFEVGRRAREWTRGIAGRRLQAEPYIYASVLANPTGDLPSSATEGEFVETILSLQDHTEVDLIRGRVSRRSFLDSLDRAHLVHYSGHVELVASRNTPTRVAAFRLHDGFLTSEEIRESLLNAGGAPLLFFNNACSSNESPASADAAESFLNSGCLHYIGALSKVQDESARKFARVFYQRMLSGESVGAALMKARNEVRADSSPADLTWSQYILYGDPATGLFGEARTAAEVKTIVSFRTVDSEFPDERRGRELNRLLSEASAGFNHSEIIPSRVPGEGGVLFDLPSEAVRFALTAINRLAQNTVETPIGIGVHMGEVSIERSEGRSVADLIHGAAAEQADLLAGVALPGQILLSKPVFDNARSVLALNDIGDIEGIEWLDHGAYLFKDLDSPVEVCEVGGKGAPLAPPKDSPRAYRRISPDQEPVLGWRPALGVRIPTSPDWELTEKLGEGGFGEVWRAAGPGDMTRVFKFCFRADRVRALKREVTLFRLLRENVGDHPNIVRLHGVYFDEAPFYIEMEDVGSSDLVKWSEKVGGLQSLSEESLLRIVLGVCSALQAAHETGIIHRDVKPSNILVDGDPAQPETIRVKLTDFGIGQVVATSVTPLVTMTGFTETYGRTEMSSGTGSRLYMAPEITVGEPASIRSDLYSLGVVLYQLVTRDVRRPLTSDWRSDITDELILEDLEGCVAGDPRGRFSSVAILADHLARLDERRIERRRSIEESHRANRRRRLAWIAASASGFLLAVSVALGVGLYQAWEAQEEAEEALNRTEEALAEAEVARNEAVAQQKRAERESYHAYIQQAKQNLDARRFQEVMKYLRGCPPDERHWEWGWLMAQCHRDLMTLRGHEGEVGALDYSDDGKFIASADAKGNIIVWDLTSGRPRLKFTGHGGQGIWTLDISADGKWIATGGEDRTARIWRTDTGEQAAVFEQPEHEVVAVRFRLKDIRLFVGTIEGNAWMWKWGEGEYADEFGKPYFSRIESLDIHPDGCHLALGGIREGSKSIDVIDLRIGQGAVHRIEDVEDRIRFIQFSPDGKWIGAAAFPNGITIRPFRSPEASGKDLSGNHSQPVWSLDFSPDGRRIATAGLDAVAFVYDVESGEVIHELEGHHEGVYRVVFSPDGNFIATSSGDGTVKVWYVGEDRKFEKLEPAPHDIRLSRFTPDGKVLLYSSTGRASTGSPAVHHFDLDAGEPMPPLVGHQGPVQFFDFSPDGERILTMSPEEERLRVWSREGGVQVDSIHIGKRSGQAPWKCLPSPSGTTLAILFQAGGVGLLDLSEKRFLAFGQNRGFTDEDVSGCWSLGGDLLYTGTGGGQIAGTLEVWSGTDLSEIAKIDAHAMGVTDIVCDPLGRWMAAGSQDKTITLWSVETMENPIRLASHGDFVVAIRFSEDGDRLFSLDRTGSVRVWRTADPNVVELLGFEDPEGIQGRSLALDCRRRRLAIGRDDRTHRLYEVFDWTLPDLYTEGSEQALEAYKRDYWRARLPLMPGTVSMATPEAGNPHLFRNSSLVQSQIEYAIHLHTGLHGEPLENLDLRSVHRLNTAGTTLSSLAGVGELPNLTTLTIEGTPIEDLSDLRVLPHLLELNLRGIQVQDLGFLRDLKTLRVLRLTLSNQPDLSPLQSLRNLEVLEISDQPVGSLECLEGLQWLRHIHLSNCSIKDASVLGGLERLEHVSLPNNRIQDIGPLMELPNLRELVLDGNPIQSPASVGKFPSLQSLHLDRTPIRDLGFLSDAEALKHISMDGVPVESLKPLGKVKSLERLVAQASGVRSLEGLEGHPNLKELNLSHSPVSDVSTLRDAPMLESLLLANCRVNTLRGIGTLPSLKVLNLDENGTENLSGIGALTGLEELSVRGSRVADLTPLAPVVTLKRITIASENAIPVKPLGGLTQLESLLLEAPLDWAGADFSRLANLRTLVGSRGNLDDLTALKGCGSLERLDLPHHLLKSLDPIHELMALKYLRLSGNPIEDATGLAHIRNLEELHLAGTRIVDTGFLVQKERLTVLDIGNTPVESLKSLPGAPNLKILMASPTKVRTSNGFENHPNLIHVNLRGAHLSEVRGFRNMPALDRLDLSANRLESLEGMSGLDNLTYLNITDNPPLSSLAGIDSVTSLIHLDALNLPVEDLEPLGRLSLLTHLKLGAPKSKSLDLLKKLTRLEDLEVIETPSGGDGGFISSLVNLRSLRLFRCGIERIDDLSALEALEILDLDQNSIADLSGLAGLKGLKYLHLVDNLVGDVSPLARCSALQTVHFGGCQIQDLTPLLENPHLGPGVSIDLTGNPLSDESIHVHLPALARRGVQTTFSPPETE